MLKNKKQKERIVRESTLEISKQININFRNYALYVLEHRGIPNFYDGLTNVQRVILMNAPKTFSKTISLIGACISNGYHHGDASLSKAINKMAKPFACGEQLLVGDGFFGTPVNPDASAPRYTSVKLNPLINELLNKYMVLNYKNSEDQWEWLRTEVPIGLLTTIIGLAVGYKSTILPRKLDEIIKFLDGKKANLNPYFKGFSGNISSYNGLKKTWLIEGVKIVEDSSKTIRITELPPLMRYESFIKKLGKLAETNIDFSIQNNSSDNVDIILKYKNGQTWEYFKDKIDKMIKLIVTEVLIFVKDGSVIEYSDLIDYLSEYRVHREKIRLDKSIYDLEMYNHELEFLKAKLEYLKFMIAKKRTNSEIEIFLNKYISSIKSKLEKIILKELSNESILKTENEIIQMQNKITKELLNKKSLEISFDKLKKETPIYSKHTKNARSVDLFIEEDLEEIDGIEVFTGEYNQINNEEEYE